MKESQIDLLIPFLSVMFFFSFKLPSREDTQQQQKIEWDEKRKNGTDVLQLGNDCDRVHIDILP